MATYDRDPNNPYVTRVTLEPGEKEENPLLSPGAVVKSSGAEFDPKPEPSSGKPLQGGVHRAIDRAIEFGNTINDNAFQRARSGLGSAPSRDPQFQQSEIYVGDKDADYDRLDQAKNDLDNSENGFAALEARRRYDKALSDINARTKHKSDADGVFRSWDEEEEALNAANSDSIAAMKMKHRAAANRGAAGFSVDENGDWVDLRARPEALAFAARENARNRLENGLLSGAAAMDKGYVPPEQRFDKAYDAAVDQAVAGKVEAALKGAGLNTDELRNSEEARQLAAATRQAFLAGEGGDILRQRRDNEIMRLQGRDSFREGDILEAQRKMMARASILNGTGSMEQKRQRLAEAGLSDRASIYDERAKRLAEQRGTDKEAAQKAADAANDRYNALVDQRTGRAHETAMKELEGASEVAKIRAAQQAQFRNENPLSVFGDFDENGNFSLSDERISGIASALGLDPSVVKSRVSEQMGFGSGASGAGGTSGTGGPPPAPGSSDGSNPPPTGAGETGTGTGTVTGTGGDAPKSRRVAVPASDRVRTDESGKRFLKVRSYDQYGQPVDEEIEMSDEPLDLSSSKPGTAGMYGRRVGVVKTYGAKGQKMFETEDEEGNPLVSFGTFLGPREKQGEMRRLEGEFYNWQKGRGLSGKQAVDAFLKASPTAMKKAQKLGLVTVWDE